MTRKIGKLASQSVPKSWSSPDERRRASTRPPLRINSTRITLGAPPIPSPDFQPWSAPLLQPTYCTNLDALETEYAPDRRSKSDSYKTDPSTPSNPSHPSSLSKLNSKQPAWSPLEEEALITVMGELVAEGSVVGEARWEVARIRLRERGFHRSAPATKMSK